VVGDQVFVTDRLLSQGEANPGDPFEKTPVGGVERILCLDDKTGQVRWKHEYPCVYSISYPSGPRAAPTFDDGRLFSLGAMGHFFCLSAVDGKILWRKEFTKTHGAEINVWGMSASPLIDGDNIILLIGGQPDAGVVALDKKTGSEKWRSLSLRDPGYCPPEIFTFGSRRLLIIWSPVAVHALDPSTGKVIWEQPFPLQSALSISSPIVTGDRLFLTAFYNGPMMLRVAPDGGSATIAWRGRSKSELNTDGLHSIMSTPVVDGESIFGVCSFGQLRCLNADTGERIWETIQATGKGRWWNAFIIKHENGYFLANEQGELVLADLKRKGYSEIGRMKLLEPTGEAQRRKVVWSHPAFAHRAVYARNDVEIVKYDLSAKSGE
jgi:outer membrane protein assembly factor BamB